MMSFTKHLHRSLTACLILLSLLAAPASRADSLPDVIARVKPSIVGIGLFDRTKSPAFLLRGTGFAIGDGHLVATNAHVLPPDNTPDARSAALVVRLPAANGGMLQQRAARVVLIERAVDLAVLKIDGPPLPTLSLSGEPVREGQSVAFTGFPIGDALGMSPVTHRAVISAITPIAQPGGAARQLNEKVIRRLKAGAFNIYQLDGTAYPGNSGGPLFDADSGTVVGIINMVYTKGTKESVLSNPSGISYAIPVAFLIDLLQELRSKE